MKDKTKTQSLKSEGANDLAMSKNERSHEAVLSAEQLWTARIAYEQHRLSLGQIARLAGVDKALLARTADEETWQQKNDGASATQAQLQTMTALLAKDIVERLRADLEALRLQEAGGPSDIEKRIKSDMALAKSIRELEAMIKELEQAAYARQYPGDVVEFRRQLEERIEALVKEEDAQPLVGGTK